MKTNFIKLSLFLAIVVFASCGNKTEESAVSTPIDSTNINGTAPVEYEVKSDTSKMLPHEEDGLKANTDTQETKKQP